MSSLKAFNLVFVSLAFPYKWTKRYLAGDMPATSLLLAVLRRHRKLEYATKRFPLVNFPFSLTVGRSTQWHLSNANSWVWPGCLLHCPCPLACWYQTLSLCHSCSTKPLTLHRLPWLGCFPCTISPNLHDPLRRQVCSSRHLQTRTLSCRGGE